MPAPKNAAGAAVLSALLVGIAILEGLTADVTWVTAETAPVEVTMNLLFVQAKWGRNVASASWYIGKHSFREISASLLKLRDIKSLSILDAKELFCSPDVDVTLQWCETWEAVLFAARLMFLAGCAAVVLYVCGAAATWYYAFRSATKTGRRWTSISFIFAPVLITLGAAQYCVATARFGEFGGSRLFEGGRTLPGAGLWAMWGVAILSWVPFAIYCAVLKIEQKEMIHADTSSDEETAATGYGSVTENGTAPTAAPVPKAAIAARAGASFSADAPVSELIPADAARASLATDAPVLVPKFDEVLEPMMVSKVTAEFVGTFILVFTVGCNVLGKNSTWGGVSIGSVLMVLVYTFASVSGSNFNPAVSVTLGIIQSLGGKGMAWMDVLTYCSAQIVGGIAAAFAYANLYGTSFNIEPAKDSQSPVFQSFVCEFVYTCMLCFVVLNVAVASRATPNKYYGLAIGSVIIAGAYGAGKLSGGCFNPAVAIGIDIASISMPGFGWCVPYLLAELLGGAAAAGLFRCVRCEDFGGTVGNLSSKLVSEFLGTYMLIFTVGLNNCENSPASAFSIAASLTAMVYAVGDVSGAMFNPAVTLAVVSSDVDGAPDSKTAGLYVLTQIVAGIFASMSYHEVACDFRFGPVSGHGWGAVATSEIVFTALLCFVVLSVACSRSNNDQFFGFAIGSCITVGGFAIGGISGGALNPAVAIGLGTVGPANKDGLQGDYWAPFIYTILELTAAVLAAGLYKITHAAELVVSQVEREKAREVAAQKAIKAPTAETSEVVDEDAL